jgi:hypothetical protein
MKNRGLDNMINNIKNVLIIFSLMVFLMGSVSAMEMYPEVWVNAEWEYEIDDPVEGPNGEN